MKKTFVIIPAINESSSIDKVILDIPKEIILGVPTDLGTTEAGESHKAVVLAVEARPRAVPVGVAMLHMALASLGLPPVDQYRDLRSWRRHARDGRRSWRFGLIGACAFTTAQRERQGAERAEPVEQARKTQPPALT